MLRFAGTRVGGGLFLGAIIEWPWGTMSGGQRVTNNTPTLRLISYQAIENGEVRSHGTRHPSVPRPLSVRLLRPSIMACQLRQSVRLGDSQSLLHHGFEWGRARASGMSGTVEEDEFDVVARTLESQLKLLGHLV